MKILRALLAITLAPLVHAAPETIKLWPDVAPGAKGDRPQDIPVLDIHLPVSASCGAAMVICPGGGYGGLALDHEGKQIAQYFNSLGVAAFVLHYRLGSQGYHHPIEVNDAKRALRWVRSGADRFKIDPARIGIIGFSAGGHLASSAATLFDDGDAKAADPIDRVSSRPDVCILGYPVISMTGEFMHRGSRNNLLGPDAKDNEDAATKVSSEKNVTSRTPTTFIFQTDEDTVVPAENAVSFYLALRKNKVPAEMHIYQRGPHGVGLMHGDPVLGSWRVHLTDWLRGNGFLGTPKRAAVEGTVTVNGRPVSWGSISFIPDSKHAPAMTARVMGGKFKLDANGGPPVGRHTLRITFSAADVPSLTEKDAPEGVVIVSKSSPNAGESLSAEIHEGVNKVEVRLTHP